MRMLMLALAAMALAASPALAADARQPERDKKTVVDFYEKAEEKFPNSRSEIKRVFADGDYVILHVHAVREPGTRGNAIVDIFRLEDGKIVEHWDVVQPIPEKAANPNGMFGRWRCRERGRPVAGRFPTSPAARKLPKPDDASGVQLIELAVKS